jgi:hypothetical protein
MKFREHTINCNHVSYPEAFFSYCKEEGNFFIPDDANVRLRVAVYYLRDFSLV